MNRIKWMRLSVRDLGDVIRWAGAQNAREIGEFRYRVVNGREIVSFRLVPRYPIDIGAREIIVVAYARVLGWRTRLRDLRRIAGAAARRLQHKFGVIARTPSAVTALPPHRIVRLRPAAVASRPRPQPLQG
jgi:hypothetical protein